MSVPPPDPRVRAHVEAARPTFLGLLSEWLRIPSVGADPAHTDDVRASAEWLAAQLRGHGWPTVEVWDTPGHPAVFAEWPAADPSAPTYLVYGHHDVQPVDPLELWDSAPFEPFVRATDHGDELVGRGAIDDKGQVLYHLLGLQAHLAATGRSAPGVHLKLVVEGEEESGSPHFVDLLREHRDRLRCDTVIVSDTGMWDRDVPSVCVGMRGLVSCQIDLHGPDGDLHSGSFGGAVPNPLTVLARFVAGLHDDDGRVTLPGFYDRVREPDAAERELLARLPFDEDAWLRTAQSRAPHGEAGWSTLERVWVRPTAELNGIWGGYTGAGGKTIVPTDAHAKISFRLVADQVPSEVVAAVRAWVEDGLPAGITGSVAFEGDGVRPCATPLDSPVLAAVLRSMARAFDAEVLFTREGGSGPEADLAEVLEVPVVFLGVGLPDDRIHAPNEKADVRCLLKGAEAVAYLWAELAEAHETTTP